MSRILKSVRFLPRLLEASYVASYHSGYKMPERKLLLLSSSNVHGYEYLQYAAEDINKFLEKSEVSRILFIPYAQTNHDEYFGKVAPVFRRWGFQVDSLHRFGDLLGAVNNAEAFFVGGGNTFLLLSSLYEKQIFDAIRNRVVTNGVPYIGTSAGTNVATKSIATTNDMPIVHPPSYDALNLVPFNINPHYLDADDKSAHRGETREERILQYLELPGASSVLAMREGATLQVTGDQAILTGISTARLYEAGLKPKELSLGANVSFLLMPKKQFY